MKKYYIDINKDVCISFDKTKNEELAFALIIELWAKIRTLDFMLDRYGIDEEPELQKEEFR